MKRDRAPLQTATETPAASYMLHFCTIWFVDHTRMHNVSRVNNRGEQDRQRAHTHTYTLRLPTRWGWELETCTPRIHFSLTKRQYFFLCNDGQKRKYQSISFPNYEAVDKNKAQTLIRRFPAVLWESRNQNTSRLKVKARKMKSAHREQAAYKTEGHTTTTLQNKFGLELSQLVSWSWVWTTGPALEQPNSSVQSVHISAAWNVTVCKPGTSPKHAAACRHQMKSSFYHWLWSLGWFSI